MNGDQWQTVGSIAGYVILGALVTWKTHKTEKKVESARDHSKAAEEYAKPTGNGFASKVTSALERIEERQRRSDQVLFDHITAHANADVARGGRSEPPSNPNAP